MADLNDFGLKAVRIGLRLAYFNYVYNLIGNYNKSHKVFVHAPKGKKLKDMLPNIPDRFIQENKIHIVDVEGTIQRETPHVIKLGVIVSQDGSSLMDFKVPVDLLFDLFIGTDETYLDPHGQNIVSVEPKRSRIMSGFNLRQKTRLAELGIGSKGIRLVVDNSKERTDS